MEETNELSEKGNLANDIPQGDNRSQNSQIIQGTFIRPQERKLHDSAVTFEEYYYYAQRTRAEEQNHEKPKLRWREILDRKKPAHHTSSEVDPNLDAAKHHTEINYADQENRIQISDEEWANASRAFRTASAGAAFYLVSIPPVRAHITHLTATRSPQTFSVLTELASRSAP